MNFPGKKLGFLPDYYKRLLDYSYFSYNMTNLRIQFAVTTYNKFVKIWCIDNESYCGISILYAALDHARLFADDAFRKKQNK